MKVDNSIDSYRVFPEIDFFHSFDLVVRRVINLLDKL